LRQVLRRDEIVTQKFSQAADRLVDPVIMNHRIIALFPDVLHDLFFARARYCASSWLALFICLSFFGVVFLIDLLKVFND